MNDPKAFEEKRSEILAEKTEKERKESDEHLTEFAREMNMDLDNMRQLYALEEKNFRSIYPKDFERLSENSPIIEQAIKSAIEKGHDMLTGLPNRRSFLKEVGMLVYSGDGYRKEDVLKEKTESERRFSIIMMDIDYFKKVNDEFGHDAGDYVLKKIAKIFSERTRGNDMIARWGGEEFIAIAPDGDQDVVFAERLRKAIEDTDFVYNGNKIDVTISVGIAPYNGDLEASREEADKALYNAKNKGRNQVQVYGEERIKNELDEN